MADDEGSPVWALGVRTRRTVWGEAAPSLELRVACPRRGHDVAVDECLGCNACQGLRVNGTTGEATLVCSADVESAPAPAADGATKADSDADAPISTIMTEDVLCVGPDLSIEALEALLLEHGISGAPVVDTAGRPVGVVSKTDLVRHHHRARTGAAAGERVVEDIMMPVAFCLPVNESVARAAALMVYEGMHRVPVVNRHGQVVGLVSALDVLRWTAQRHGYVLGPKAR